MKLLTVSYVFIFFALLNFAQTTNNIQHKSYKPNKIESSQTVHSINGNVMLQSGYDYTSNFALRKLAMHDLDGDGINDPMIVGLERLTEGGVRKIVFAFSAFGVTDFIVLFDTTQSYGWPSLQYCEGGPFDGNALVGVSSPSGVNWALIDMTQFTTTYISNNLTETFSSFKYLSDGTVWIMASGYIYKSTDQLNTLEFVTKVGDGDPEFNQSFTNFPSDMLIDATTDGQYIAVVTALEGASTGNVPDGVYWYYSTDAGNTWQGEFIGYGSGSYPVYGQVTNRDYAPYFTNFGQGSFTVEETTGVTHVVFNGYGEGVLPGASDTTLVFPVLYWNNMDKNWIAVSKPVYEAPDDGFGNSIINNYPGNGIGEAYPAIVVNGDVVFVSWQAVEFTGEPGMSPYNIYPGDGGVNTGEVYYTDLMQSISLDGGVTFDNIEKIISEPNVSENYPALAELRFVTPTELLIPVLYYIDPVPGVSLFSGGNSFSPDGEWVFENYTFVTIIDDVNDDNSLVNEFRLYQNYPNPFNPSTKIQYAIGSRQYATLKVYDVLGNEVATLVSEVKPVGTYEVEFNAEGLPSGVYFYRLQAGNYVQSRKMILLR